MIKIAVIDGQGGGIGKIITEKIRKNIGLDIYILALGTNALAASLMLKAGANEASSGENAIINGITNVDVIIGTLGIVIPNSMLGEITPAMAGSVNLSKAHKILLPLVKGKYIILGNKNEPLPHIIDEMLEELTCIINKRIKMEESNMCEANAYIIKDGEEVLLLERVDKIIPQTDGLFLENIFGEQKVINARIKQMQLVSHKIILEHN